MLSNLAKLFFSQELNLCSLGVRFSVQLIEYGLLTPGVSLPLPEKGEAWRGGGSLHCTVKPQKWPFPKL